ncbi:MAG TPA: hypothetical protein VN520_04865 [Streptomyces sp.]|uniref:hypothetical protein n=1 Tax=Streptomyces sp. TaxID=1931 RepID=UPI002C18C5FE|nr:hypothetical protein [Streptomyces sp.]HWU05720.1 hypothetical protein [Streptomyces sp.]
MPRCAAALLRMGERGSYCGSCRGSVFPEGADLERLGGENVLVQYEESGGEGILSGFVR